MNIQTDGKPIDPASTGTTFRRRSSAIGTASSVASRFALGWAGDERARHPLRRYAAPLARSGASPEVEAQRQGLVSDWLTRSCLPRWLAEAGLHPVADGLRALPALQVPDDLAAVTDLARAARRAAWVKEQAARDVSAGVAGRAAPAGEWEKLEAAVTTAQTALVTPWVVGAIQSGLAADDPVWDLVADTITDASASIAWQAVSPLPPASEPPVGSSAQHVRRALDRPVGDLRDSALRLVAQLLDLPSVCGWRAGRGSGPQ